MTSTEDKLRKAKEEIHTSSVTDNMYKNQTELSNKSHAAEMERAGALIDPAYESKEDAEHYAELAKEYANRTDNATQAAAEALERANEAIAHSNAAIATINDKAAETLESINATADATTATLATQVTEATTQATTAKGYADAANVSATQASDAATSAAESDASAERSAHRAGVSEKAALSYLKGGTDSRENEDLDNVVYYYEQIVNKLGSIQGALRPMGTITFAELTALTDPVDGDMYNISDEFTSNATFKDGAGVAYGAGTNVYRTADGYWDALPSACVAGIKGDKELTYRKGNVNMTPANLGAVASDGGDATNTTVTLEGFLDYTMDQLDKLSEDEIAELFHTWAQSTKYLVDTVPSNASLKDYLILALNNYVFNKFFQHEYNTHKERVDGIALDADVTQDTIGYSRRNLLHNMATTTTLAGITFTVNKNGSVTLNGTSTAKAELYLADEAPLPRGELIGSISETYITDVNITFGYYKEDGSSVDSLESTPTWTVLEFPEEAVSLLAYITVPSGTTLNNVTVYPMLQRSVSDLDLTYAPYVEDVDTRIEALKKSVADGKALLANTVSYYGTPTASNATFETIDTNFRTELTNTYNEGVAATKKGTAEAAHVLEGYTFTSAVEGVDVNGTMANRGAWSNTPTTAGDVIIPAGYHNGSGKVNTVTVWNNAVAAADNRANANSVNYQTGYNAGVTAGRAGYVPKNPIVMWFYGEQKDSGCSRTDTVQFQVPSGYTTMSTSGTMPPTGASAVFTIKGRVSGTSTWNTFFSSASNTVTSSFNVTGYDLVYISRTGHGTIGSFNVQVTFT